MAGLTAISFGSKRVPGYEIGDDDSPAIIWIHEWWGVTNIVKQQACATAARGYRVLIPDLYKGTLGHDMEEALHLMTSLNYDAAVEEIRDAAQYLLETGGLEFSRGAIPASHLR
jgi:carboxymethylenebutenolidase